MAAVSSAWGAEYGGTVILPLPSSTTSPPRMRRKPYPAHFPRTALPPVQISHAVVDEEEGTSPTLETFSLPLSMEIGLPAGEATSFTSSLVCFFSARR